MNYICVGDDEFKISHIKLITLNKAILDTFAPICSELYSVYVSECMLPPSEHNSFDAVEYHLRNQILDKISLIIRNHVPVAVYGWVFDCLTQEEIPFKQCGDIWLALKENKSESKINSKYLTEYNSLLYILGKSVRSQVDIKIRNE